MTVISSRKPAPAHTIQEVMDAIAFVVPHVLFMTFNEAAEFIHGSMRTLEHMKYIENPVVQLHPMQTHIDIGFQLVGDTQFYYTAVIVSNQPKHP